MPEHCVEERCKPVDRGVEERAPTMLLLGIHPAFDTLRGDERFVERLHQIGLPA
jgi:hypothetical protein